VVAHNTEPALFDYKINDPARMWTPVDQITDKAELIIFWAFLDQRHKRAIAAMHIANYYQVSLHHLLVTIALIEAARPTPHLNGLRALIRRRQAPLAGRYQGLQRYWPEIEHRPSFATPIGVRN
jgi:hypothetical protein